MSTSGTLRSVVPFLPVGGALFCIQLDFFSLNLALPSIAADLGTTATNLQWLVSGYMIALGSLLIPAGRAGDVLGRRRVLLVGVAIFGRRRWCADWCRRCRSSSPHGSRRVSARP
ncbi:MAG: transporter [Pseudonocardia sp.]|jgi:MFS family permease|nr:transporter [Pseudonocardia sp.]